MSSNSRFSGGMERIIKCGRLYGTLEGRWIMRAHARRSETHNAKQRRAEPRRLPASFPERVASAALLQSHLATGTTRGSELIAEMANNLIAELTQHLNARHLYPTAAWLQSFVPTIRPNTPLPALKQTALFRLLATDITTSLAPPANTVFPIDVLNAKIQSRHVAGPVICQVLDIEDIGLSRWAQVEAIEAKERGETTKGREIVRVVENENKGEAVAPAVQSKGPFKVLLQDAKGTKVYGIDLRGIDGLNSTMTMGVKLLLRNVDVRRAVVMLEPGYVQVLGGKIEILDKAWKEGRKERLMNGAKDVNADST